MPESLAKVLVHIVYSTRHHKCISFQDEFRALCPRHRVTLDGRYARDWPARSFISLGPPRWGWPRFARLQTPGLRTARFPRRAPPWAGLGVSLRDGTKKASRPWRGENLSRHQPLLFSVPPEGNHGTKTAKPE